ncbi:DUF5658 family protein [Planococcus sp. 1R117A]|uniref:DUF5658 family protein n=1 Tax=Planococcus sp. 1R117A TaxID=3447020 RepID=UPI003EDBC25D
MAEQNTPLKTHVWILGILNILDGILTFFGIKFGYITEGNPLLSSFSPFSILTIKFFLSLCLFSLLFTPFISNHSRHWRYLLISANVLYFLILFLHASWVAFVVMAHNFMFIVQMNSGL